MTDTGACFDTLLCSGTKRKGEPVAKRPAPLEVTRRILFGNTAHHVVNIVHGAQQVCFGSLFSCFDLQLSGIV